MLFEEFHKDNPPWKEEFPDGKVSQGAGKQLQGARNILAHTKPSPQRVLQILNKCQTKLAEVDMLQCAQAVCAVYSKNAQVDDDVD